jgi:hypothetical protein
MDCRITFTKRARSGTTLVDVMIGSALASVVLLILGALVLFGARSFAAMANYVSLDQCSRDTLDRMSKEIRQCNRLVTASTNSLTFEDADGQTLRYYYSEATHSLRREKNGVVDPRPLLTRCDYLEFSIYQRNPIMGTYDQYPTATPATCKLVQLRWICSRPLFNDLQNTESVQSAKVVIRKE